MLFTGPLESEKMEKKSGVNSRKAVALCVRVAGTCVLAVLLGAGIQTYVPGVCRHRIVGRVSLSLCQHADVGNKMEAYYDKKEKRWVFPDETPEDKAAVLPSAPPTAAQLNQSASPTGPRAASPAPAPTPGMDANDPLAALMAPPKSSVQSARRHTSVGVHPAGGGPPSGGMNWGNMTPPMSGGLSARSPFPPPGQNFTVFAPKAPAASASSNASGGAGPDVGSTEDSQQPAAS